MASHHKSVGNTRFKPIEVAPLYLAPPLRSGVATPSPLTRSIRETGARTSAEPSARQRARPPAFSRQDHARTSDDILANIPRDAPCMDPVHGRRTLPEHGRCTITHTITRHGDNFRGACARNLREVLPRDRRKRPPRRGTRQEKMFADVGATVARVAVRSERRRDASRRGSRKTGQRFPRSVREKSPRGVPRGRRERPPRHGTRQSL
jgi:hypothetical protein